MDQDADQHGDTDVPAPEVWDDGMTAADPTPLARNVAAIQSAVTGLPTGVQSALRVLVDLLPVLGALGLGLALGLWSGLQTVLVVVVGLALLVLVLWVVLVFSVRVNRLHTEVLALQHEAQVLRQSAARDAKERALLSDKALNAARAVEQQRARTAAQMPLPTEPEGEVTGPGFASMRDPRLSQRSADGRMAMTPPPSKRDEDQPALALATPQANESDPVTVADFTRALQFPEGADDVEGFAAMRRVLPDRNMAKLIRAVQDVLTLLARDGIFMDELAPDRARPDLWRRFAAGERGRAVAALGGIRDRSCLALTGQRMREDPVFRDAAHHFLRSFDRALAEIEPRCQDEDLADLSDTRTARAFMLIGRVAGTFD